MVNQCTFPVRYLNLQRRLEKMADQQAVQEQVQKTLDTVLTTGDHTEGGETALECALSYMEMPPFPTV